MSISRCDMHPVKYNNACQPEYLCPPSTHQLLHDTICYYCKTQKKLFIIHWVGSVFKWICTSIFWVDASIFFSMKWDGWWFDLIEQRLFCIEIIEGWVFTWHAFSALCLTKPNHPVTFPCYTHPIQSKYVEMGCGDVGEQFIWNHSLNPRKKVGVCTAGSVRSNLVRQCTTRQAAGTRTTATSAVIKATEL